MGSFHTPLDDSGLILDSLNVAATDAEEIDFELKTHKKTQKEPHGKENKCPKYKAPACFVESQKYDLKRHILTKHKQKQKVIPLLKLNPKEQDFVIAQSNREAIRIHNLKFLNEDQTGFL